MTESESEEDDEDDWLMGSFIGIGVLGDSDNNDTDDDNNSTANLPQQHEQEACVINEVENEDLSVIMKRLSQAFTPRDDDDDEASNTMMVYYYQERINLVQCQMGSMALCRGARGEVLREAGAIDALLLLLYRLKNQLPCIQQQDVDEACPPSATRQEHIVIEPDDEASLDMKAMELAIACMGALRDLSCGSALNRSAIRDFVYTNDDAGKTTTTRDDGLALLAAHLERYHGCTWDCVMMVQHHSSSSIMLDLRLLTSIIGVLRNVTHSTRENCLELHQCQVTSMLIWRLLLHQADHHNKKNNNATIIIGNSSYLPDASQPWREAAFRAAGTLINMSEKCEECAVMCASNPLLIQVLVEASSWGGGGGRRRSSTQKKTPLLHLGLAAILRAAEKELLPRGLFDESWHEILLKEQERKRIAQRKEEERKAAIET